MVQHYGWWCHVKMVVLKKCVNRLALLINITITFHLSMVCAKLLEEHEIVL